MVQKGWYHVKLVEIRQKDLIGVEYAVEINDKVMHELTSMAESMGCIYSLNELVEDGSMAVGQPLKTRLGEIRLAV
jgi:hypothetical protein